MKARELKIGQIVVDQYGNEYEVLKLFDVLGHVTFKCTKFVKKVEIREGVFVRTGLQTIHIIDAEYYKEHYGLEDSNCRYVTIASLSPKVEYMLSSKNINSRFNTILSRVADLAQCNNSDNVIAVRQAINDLRSDLLECIKNLELEGKAK